MKVTINESYPGEFNEHPSKIKTKIAKAAGSSLRAILDGECDREPLRKAHRGGEIQIVEDLSSNLRALYKKRMVLLNKAMQEAIEANAKN